MKQGNGTGNPWGDLQNWATRWASVEQWQAIGGMLLKIVVILIVSRLLIWLIHKAITVSIINARPARLQLQERRMVTVGKLLKNVTSYAVHFITLLLVLGTFGIDLAPLLAGAGVVGLAIGFGAQSLVKDVITGFFIILEDQFAVGDVIQTGDYKGTVEVIGLRTTRIQSLTGEVYIVPNGSIVAVTNFSLRNSLAVVDISVKTEEGDNRAIEIISGTLASLKDENLVRQPEILGVQALSPDETTLRVIAECRPNTQTLVTRRLNAEIKLALDREGIRLPYPKMVAIQKVT